MVKEVRKAQEATAAAENPVTNNAIPVAVPSVEEVAVQSFKRLYLEGTLTIRDLLMTQPLVIVGFI